LYKATADLIALLAKVIAAKPNFLKVKSDAIYLSGLID
jgi:hypothetical protein